MAGTKHDEGKPAVDQIPPEVLMEWGEIFAYGAVKYAPDDWRKGFNWRRIYGAALRHTFKFWMGEDYDECDGSEGCAILADFCPVHSRKSHLSQAIWNLGCLRYYQIYGLGTDDRPHWNQENING